MVLENCVIMLIDNGSSVDVLFYSTFLIWVYINRGDNCSPYNTWGIPSTGYSLSSVQFIVVKSESAYNAIFGRSLQSIF
ncbi:hypothetical protein IEQ34_016198 [Dendrobium chrysotoxum]|uniref:Uncharacterized protein n=1 Tax=Dendrobium chrysotoxum TaxID=161865 RepID=A0AAV7FXF3_DENCH|nr:hypothetical protein IEQ34_016198 [Dendrobium chrysotoxum]